MEIFSIIDVVSPSFVVSIRVLHNPLKHMFYRLHRYSHSHHLHRPPLEQNWQINTHISSMKNFEEEGVLSFLRKRRRNDFVDCDLEKVNLVYTVCRTFKNPTGLMKLSTIQCEKWFFCLSFLRSVSHLYINVFLARRHLIWRQNKR
ncbi:unnamed protein product [Lactuca virosa]|uniref:Uncharacterized protein n=1 Tax=Lactuca virosa TaxID=75947 RepID=A0AAU9P4F9_9ASTR|nr:unnamed protein product [Lactuca virosa]